MNRVFLITAATALVAAACSSPSDVSQSDETPPATVSTVAISTTTLAPTTTVAEPAPTTAPAAEPASEEDVAEITALYEIVFSSDTTYEEKVPLIDDPTGLEDTVAEYQETGESLGGVGLVARTITVNGDTADVTYDLLFAGNPTYPDLKGDAIRVDGTWLVTRELFCSIMTSARVGCPSS